MVQLLELSRLTQAVYRACKGSLMETANLSGISDKDQNLRLLSFLLFLSFLCIPL